MGEMSRKDPIDGKLAATTGGEFLSPADGGYAGPAAEKLAALEDLCKTLLSQQESIRAQFEQLRSQGKTRCNKFRKLMGQKLLNSHTIGLLELHGLM